MGRRKASIGKAELERAVAAREGLSEWRTVFRLTAVIAYAVHTAAEVSVIMNVSPENVIRWAGDFKRDGVEGLRCKSKGHRQRRLGDAESEDIKSWVVSRCDPDGNPVHLRNVHLWLGKVG